MDVIKWVEAFEDGSVEAQDYHGSWRELMECVTAGAVSHDAACDLIDECAGMAKCPVELNPAYEWSKICGKPEDESAALVEQIVEMGVVADQHRRVK